MFNVVDKIKTVWLFLFNVISIDSESLREDARKIGLGLLLAGIVGYILRSDKVSSGESMLLFAVGLILWVAALLKPTSNEGSQNDRDNGG